MTEREISLLGFEQVVEKDLNWGTYYYYSLEITGGMGLISNPSDEIKEGEEWYVEFFDCDPEIRFYKFEEVQALINLLERNKLKK